MYNDSFIKCFDNSKYNNTLLNVQNLDKLKEMYLSKYKDGTNINGEALAFKESLDHYVLKSIMANKDLLNTTEFRNYFNYIQDICRAFPTERCTNPIFQIPESKLEQIFAAANGDYKEFMDRRQMTEGHKKLIMKTINKGGLVSQEELNKVCEYYANRRQYDSDYNNLITYIFTNLPKYDYLKCSYQVLDSILTYLPFEYNPKEMKELSENDFNPKDNRVIFTNIIDNNKFEGPGIALGKLPIVYLNRSIFENINFKSIDDSKKTFLHRGTDFTFMMIVAFHEITHQLQRAKSCKEKLTDQGFMSALNMILNRELCDYRINHSNDDIEIDATKVGWEMCHSFYTKHYKMDNLEELQRNCYRNVNSTDMRYGIATKKTKDGRIVDKNEYDITNLSNIIKSNVNILEVYPSLKNLYTSTGDIRADIMYADVFSKTIEKYILYLLRNTNLKEFEHKDLSDHKVDKLIENIFKSVKSNIEAINKIEYTREHDNDGEYKKNVEDQEKYDQLLKNAFNDFYIMIEILKMVCKTDKHKKFAGDTIKWVRNMLIKICSPNYPSYININDLSYEERINILNDVIKKANSIGVNSECVEYFDSKKRYLIDKMNQNNSIQDETNRYR